MSKMFVCKRDSSTLVAVVVASLVLLFGAVGSQTIRERRFSYVRFNEREHNQDFIFTGGSSIDGGALQLTPDSQNNVVSLQNTFGRIVYHQPFKLWLADIDKKEEDDIVASFSSYFYINIFRNKEWNAGEGLTFLIAPTADAPEQSWGQWMGLTNATTDGDSRNQIVAIEFDTEKQDFDPDDNHIGLNINSIKSRKAVSLNKSGIVLSPETGTNHSIWVDYDGKAKLLQVYMSINKDPKPDKPLLNETINLKRFVKQESYIGFSASTGSPEIQLNCVLEWTLDLERLPEKKNLTWLKILAGVGIPILIAILIGVWLFVDYRKKRRVSRDEESNVQGTLKRLPGMPREFKYKELKRATHNFHESMVLGNGGFGVVYKGVLQDKDKDITTSSNSVSRLEIAVKKFSRDSIKSEGDFLDELTIIHRLRHKNLVRLEGWCYEKGKLLLVYDFMPNGSVENHLYDVADEDALSWRHRYKILVGVASALHYLHNLYDQKVLHRDIKSSNILLDSDFNARLGDFGLARALDPERNSYADLQCGGVAGTMGYVAPECFHEGKATPETDVYGFGAVVLEIICGRRPGAAIEDKQNLCTLIDWVWKGHREGHIEKAVDNRLGNGFVVDEARRLLLLGLACTHPTASERPQTQAILQILNGALPAPQVPLFKPAFMWPPMSTTSTNTTLTSLSNTNSSLP
ncbi:probable L-type lectin-domain containing receptor kinase S.5 [Cucurbita moschata]|uniref:Probable L-type lectin-domain containing receptor kinase S.5 n=1 Tax=Cucurbita moschata TaxID=3662 RepID=A0A6J1GLC1_CUCMO|nr:probable L-type lectin-domain containing receptor kinase S.5 [Cucurbita moschata]